MHAPDSYLPRIVKMENDNSFGDFAAFTCSIPPILVKDLQNIVISGNFVQHQLTLTRAAKHAFQKLHPKLHFIAF